MDVKLSGTKWYVLKERCMNKDNYESTYIHTMPLSCKYMYAVLS